jgi:hypothetical protein
MKDNRFFLQANHGYEAKRKHLNEEIYLFPNRAGNPERTMVVYPEIRSSSCFPIYNNNSILFITGQILFLKLSKKKSYEKLFTRSNKTNITDDSQDDDRAGCSWFF